MSTESREIANTIYHQINWGVKMALGAHNPYSVPAIPNTDIYGGLTFLARVLPFTKAGTRSSAARIMSVTIMLNGMDLYDITVSYTKRGAMGETVEHARATDIDVSTLNRWLLALDYDGAEVLNPRYYGA